MYSFLGRCPWLPVIFMGSSFRHCFSLIFNLQYIAQNTGALDGWSRIKYI